MYYPTPEWDYEKTEILLHKSDCFAADTSDFIGDDAEQVVFYNFDELFDESAIFFRDFWCERAPMLKDFEDITISLLHELGHLERALTDFIDVLAPGGRFAVISFHSLEDRIVKETFAKRLDPCICPPDFPVCVCGRKPDVKKVTKKPVTADSRELESNPRSRSAKLRVIEKL